MRAADMFEEGGITKAEIARRLGVAHQTVSDCMSFGSRAAGTR